MDLAAKGIDDRHEDAGPSLLEPLFGRGVSQPVALHVAAKRYLCAVDPAYADCLSPDSVRSLALQGGPMGAAEVATFQTLDGWQAAVTLRRIDDQAKVPGLPVPPLEHWRPLAQRLLIR